jgi:hypothetical protein
MLKSSASTSAIPGVTDVHTDYQILYWRVWEETLDCVCIGIGTRALGLLILDYAGVESPQVSPLALTCSLV